MSTERDRDAGASGGFGVAARGVDPAAEHEAGHHDRDHDGDASDEERRVRQPPDRPTADGLDDVRNAADRLAVGEPQGEAAGDAQRRQRDDERMGQPAPDVAGAVDEADRRAGGEHHDDDDRSAAAVAEGEGAEDRGQRQRRADRQIDSLGDDHEQLADRQQGDRRRLRQDVADVAGGEEHGRQQRHGDDEAGQDEDRTEPDHRQGATKQSVAAPRAHVFVRFAVHRVGRR